MLLLLETYWRNVTYMTSQESLSALKGLASVLGLGRNMFRNTFNVINLIQMTKTSMMRYSVFHEAF